MAFNRVAVTISYALEKYSKFEYMYLSKNILTGSLHSNIGDLSTLEELNFSINHIRGTLPSAVLGLRQMKRLNISENNIVGGIPKTNG